MVFLFVANTISNISDCSPEAESKLLIEVSVNNEVHPNTEGLQTTKEEPQANVTTKATQPPPPATHPPAITEAHSPIKIYLKEQCLQSMGERMWNKNYTLQYMNYATTTNNITYFTTIYKYDPKAEDYSVECSLSHQRTRAILNMATVKNQIIYLLVPYVANDMEQYCVGLKKRKSREVRPLHAIGLRPATVDNLYKIYKKFNYQLVGERYVTIKDEVRATSIFRRLAQATQVMRYRDLSYNALMSKITEGQRKGYHIVDVSSYTLRRMTHYSLLLTTNSNKLQYRWSLRSRQRTKGTLKMLTKQGLYPLAIVRTNLGYSEPYYLVSLTSAT